MEQAARIETCESNMKRLLEEFRELQDRVRIGLAAGIREMRDKLPEATIMELTTKILSCESAVKEALEVQKQQARVSSSLAVEIEDLRQMIPSMREIMACESNVKKVMEEFRKQQNRLSRKLAEE